MDLERVDRITAGAVGEPGERTFFLQAREGDRSITILVEKEQVELLGTSILEILATVGRETGEEGACFTGGRQGGRQIIEGAQAGLELPLIQGLRARVPRRRQPGGDYHQPESTSNLHGRL